MRKLRSAFTLVELIVVISITAVILGLLIIPIVQSFNFTRSAQGFADGQERARRLIERITNEIANSPGVRDNSGSRGQIDIVVPDNNGVQISLLAEYAKIDILKPLQGDPTLRGPGGGYIVNGVEDPTAHSSKGQMVFPVAPGATIARYYVSLKHPLAANGLNPAFYYNPYVDYKRNTGIRWMTVTNQEDNLYVIRRLEVAPKILNPGSGTMVVNSAFFDDANGDGEPDLDDPYFMTQDPPGFPLLPLAQRQAKALRIKNWVAKSEIVTEFYRFDAIQPLIDKTSRQLLVLGTVPRVSTLIQFRPASVMNEPAAASSTLRLGNETDNPAAIASDVFLLKSGAWSSAAVRTFPAAYNPADPANNDYFIARFDPRAGVRTYRIYKYDPDLDTDADDRNGEGNPADDIEVFDVDAYEQQIRRGFLYPFRRAMEASNTRSGWLSNAPVRAKFMPFVPSLNGGKIVTSFHIEDWGIDDPTGAIVPLPSKNLPFQLTGPEVTPTTDPTPPGNFYDAAYLNMNRLFTKVWGDHPELRAPGGVHRFIDLRVTAQEDGTPSPLDPDPTVGFRNGYITPGSEIITGPDQNRGPTYGMMTKYTRVTRNPGPNQYVINYVDQREPDYALLGYAAPPALYDSTNFVSAIIQARYKAGYIMFNSDPNLPLPAGSPAQPNGVPISVSYRFQFNQPNDTIAVDYDTRSLIEVLLTIRNYPQSTLPTPAMITVKGSAPIRNLAR